MEHTLGEFLAVGIAVGDASPQEHSHLIGVVGASKHIHYLLGILAAAGVGLDVCLAVPLRLVGEGGCGGKLDATERAAVDIALNLEYPRDEGGVGGAHTDTPSRHVMALGHGVELDAAILCALHLKQRHGFLVEDEGIGVVVDHHNVMAACEINKTLVGLHAGITTCGHVGIVGPHELYLGEVHLLQLFEVRLPSVVLHEVVVHHLGAENLAQRGVGGIAGVGHEHLLAGVNEGEGYMQYALL